MLSTTDTHIRYNIWLIDFEGKIKPERLSVREAMERPNGRRIMRKFNNKKQPIGDKAGLLSSVLGLLGSDYENFSICKESWHKITTKDKVYNKRVKQIFHFDEDSKGTIKKNILKSMGKSWKKTSLRLYNAFYEPTFTTEQNIEHRPPGIDQEHWRWFLDYRAKMRQRRSAGKTRLIDQNNYIPTLAVRKASHGGWKKRFLEKRNQVEYVVWVSD
ncbi:uncharacterized protein LOC107613006 [Arachis ipaensis]|nr:uncharacterized protein LOC107613006 [Arachis ipaensis]XP_020964768.1 uncharacterized protein LOC107613006 [Arachis ipaensis]XP_020964769.1 uncharacterized protein LOC107613006 [Arachis ipaensis]XP_020964770.1 uncharacterized protein LOC107613006 [Arachis ipaensis]XP_020964771.1 uncharacterized protein LOC107613006 [Arachis ipaensis]XP_029150921.1 uncharacterized protein LOC112769366 isoform X1 [Arachis hypogaea]